MLLLSVIIPALIVVLTVGGLKVGGAGVSKAATVVLGVGVGGIIYVLTQSSHDLDAVLVLGGWWGGGSVEWGFTWSLMSTMILGVVLAVGTAVGGYSIWYIQTDPYSNRFIGTVFGFVFFIGILVSSKNWALFFLGWEGIGIVSFLLISFWQTRAVAMQSAFQSMALNRVGDMGLTFSMILLVNASYSWDLQLTQVGLEWKSTFYRELVVYTALIAVAGKSAQLGLHAWLPNAMEAPTPVSALIHAATLVTAGVYLLMRLAPLLEGSTSLVCQLLGMVSLIYAGFVGLTQTDAKRVIAFSTISQIGYMVLGCGWGLFDGAFLMLMSHAFYKSLLFLGVGGVIHAGGNNQDIRKSGGLGLTLPLNKILFLCASLCLIASPFTSGEWGKDVLLELGSEGIVVLKNLSWLVALTGVAFTGYYSTRILSIIFAGENRMGVLNSQHEMPLYGIAILTVLAVISTSGGYALSSLFETGIGVDDNSLYPAHNQIMKAEIEITPGVGLAPVGWLVLGLILGPNHQLLPLNNSLYPWQVLSRNQGGFVQGLIVPITNKVLGMSHQALKTENGGSVEMLSSWGPVGLVAGAAPQSELTARVIIAILVGLVGGVVFIR